MGYTFTTLAPADAGKIMELQYAYQAKYPKAIVIPAEVYLSPPMYNGDNVICAFDDNGILAGYIAVNANIAHQPDVPHTVWSIVKVALNLAAPRALQDALFEKAVAKAKEMVQPYPDHEIHLMFQHHTEEKDAISFLESKGCVYIESTYHMIYDLSIGPAPVSTPEGITVCDLDVKNDVKVRAYIDGKNECFSRRFTTVEDWRRYFNTLGGGKVIAAYDNDALAGAITVSWNEELNRRIGIDMGETEDVFVREPWRQRGIAAFLISLGQGYLAKDGRRFSHLEVRGTNENALKLYKKTGYIVGDETWLLCLKL